MLLALGFLFALLLLTFLSTKYVDSHPHANGTVMSSPEQPISIGVSEETTIRPEEPDLVTQEKNESHSRFAQVS